jgi:hypothetical protein
VAITYTSPVITVTSNETDATIYAASAAGGWGAITRVGTSKYIYDWGNTRLVISGASAIVTFTLENMWGTWSDTQKAISVASGGRLIVGSNASPYAHNRILDFRKPLTTDTLASQETSSCIYLANGTTFDWYSGEIQSRLPITFDANATVNVSSTELCHLVNEGLDTSTSGYYPQIRQRSSNTNITGLTAYGYALVLIGNASHFDNYIISYVLAAIIPSSSTPANTWVSFFSPDFSNNVTYAAYIAESKWIRIVNNKLGTNGACVTYTATSALNKGIVEFRKEVVFYLTAGSGAKVYLKDTDNGLRLGANQVGTNPDYTADREYIINEAGGVGSYTTNGGILIGVKYNSLGGAATVNDKFDSRGITNDAADNFTVLQVEYGRQSVVSVVNLKGTGVGSFTLQSLMDLGITQGTKATVAAYTGFTVETATGVTITEAKTTSQVYDRRKYLESENPAWVWDNNKTTYCSSASGSVYDFDTDYTIYLQETLSGKPISGARLVLAPGWGIACSVQDATFVFPNTVDYDLRDVTILGTAGATLINTSGAPIIVKLAPDTVYINVGPDITVESSLTVSITLPELLEGTRVRVYDTTNAIELDNSLILGTTGYALSYTYLAPISVEIYAIYVNGTTACQQLVIFGNVTATGFSSPVEQELDSVYIANAIDGSTVTEYIADFPNVQVDIDDPDGRSPVQRLYAWYTALCHTEDGIVNWVGAITAIDSLNYRINTDQVNLKLDNVGVPFILYGGKLLRSDGATIIASGSIQIDWPDLLYTPPTQQALTYEQFVGLTLALKD